VKFAQSWVELQPDFGGITTHGGHEIRPELGGVTTQRWVVLRHEGRVKFARSWVELQPDFGGITTCGAGDDDPEWGIFGFICAWIAWLTVI
jgi:hypothetical protein